MNLDTVKKSWPGLLILTSFLLPMLLAWWFFHYSEYPQKGAKKNYGSLITPILTVPDQILSALPQPEAVEHTRLPRRTLHGYWSLTYRLPADCNADCRRAIRLLHQIEQALGKDSLRVQRILQYPEKDIQTRHLGPDIRSQWPGQWRLTKPTELHAVLRKASVSGPIYLIDPRGNLVMHYPEHFDPNALLKDLRHLLKASRIG